jgi:hypothetical protein
MNYGNYGSQRRFEDCPSSVNGIADEMTYGLIFRRLVLLEKSLTTCLTGSGLLYQQKCQQKCQQTVSVGSKIELRKVGWSYP